MEEKEDTKLSWKWFWDREYEALATVAGAPVNGSMISFRYNPKYRDTLPYYDRFPLIFPFSRYGNTFTGINLHYLSPRERLVVINKLLYFAKGSEINENTVLHLSWDNLKSSTVSKYIRGAIRKYNTGYVVSPYIMIHPEEWNKAVLLPTADFGENSTEQIWAMRRNKQGKPRRR